MYFLCLGTPFLSLLALPPKPLDYVVQTRYISPRKKRRGEAGGIFVPPSSPPYSLTLKVKVKSPSRWRNPTPNHSSPPMAASSHPVPQLSCLPGPANGSPPCPLPRQATLTDLLEPLLRKEHGSRISYHEMVQMHTCYRYNKTLLVLLYSLFESRDACATQMSSALSAMFLLAI